MLKGAAGGYGYPEMTEVVGAIESSMEGGDEASPSLNSRLAELDQLCRLALRGFGQGVCP